MLRRVPDLECPSKLTRSHSHASVKVETVGDCYVAAAGIPNPRKDHALAIARFARDIMIRFARLTKDLEVTLGPDTGDLTLRVGLNSGPVTAGVLRGERARFQLFGDTMNTTARIEETGEGGRIHVSHETAALIMEGGKGLWLEKRIDTVTAKGKGDLETYWLTCSNRDGGSVVSGDAGTKDIGVVCDLNVNHGYQDIDARTSRLINWIVISMAKLLRNIVARRNALVILDGQETATPKSVPGLPAGKTYLDEVKEIIHLPDFDPKAYRKEEDPETIQLPEEVIDQLKDYVTCIATMYRRNSFHNFEVGTREKGRHGHNTLWQNVSHANLFHLSISRFVSMPATL
jgi:Adenylate and Guanylate cyclase catalytic domain